MLEGVRLADMEQRLAASARSFLHYSTRYAIVGLSGLRNNGSCPENIGFHAPAFLRLDMLLDQFQVESPPLCL